MVPPLLYVVSRKADNVNGYRFEANLLDLSLPPAEAARCAGRHAGFEMHPNPDRARGGYSSRKPARRRPAYSVFSARAVNRGLV
jgi:hypothetical protein